MSEYLANSVSGPGQLIREGTAQAVYFLGIGGIGMSALARYFKHLGARVSGYDKTITPLTKQLQQEGIEVHYDDDISKADLKADFVIYTPAIPKNHKELNYLKSNGYHLLKRSEVLGKITEGKFTICVAGTHGKTTTSAMIAHILRDSGVGCNAFLGGIASNYDTNFWAADNDVCVAEADEYDRSFLQLSPNISIITAMDPDHLDIYGTEENMQDAFLEFAAKIEKGGLLILKNDVKRLSEFNAESKVLYSLNSTDSNAFASDMQIHNGSYSYSVNMPGAIIENVVLNMGGLHNVENSIAAIIAVKQMGLSDDAIRKSLASFRGVKRRFEYILKENDMVMIDDYAHHPEELRALIEGAKNLFPGKKCTVIFQPHLFSRTRDLADGFAEVLDIADEVVLLPIYPARELPIEGVSSEMILEKMKLVNKRILEKTALLGFLKNYEAEMLITAGAGDIDALVQPIKEILQKS